jgi:hypothetical protein
MASFTLGHKARDVKFRRAENIREMPEIPGCSRMNARAVAAAQREWRLAVLKKHHAGPEPTETAGVASR